MRSPSFPTWNRRIVVASVVLALRACITLFERLVVGLAGTDRRSLRAVDVDSESPREHVEEDVAGVVVALPDPARRVLDAQQVRLLARDGVERVLDRMSCFDLPWGWS